MSKIVYVTIAVVVVVAAVFAVYYLGFLSKPVEKVLRVGTSPDFPPFEYVDEKTGEVVGIDIDLIKAIANRLGYKVQIVSMDFDGLIPALEQGQVDVVISGMTITEERAKRVDFSIPYWKADQAIIVSKGSSFKPLKIEDLVNHTVGVQSGTTAEQLLDSYVSKGYNINVKRYSSYTLAVQDLINGRVDAVVVDSPVANTLAKKYSVEVAATITTGEEYGIAVKKGNKALLDQINKALSEILNSSEWDSIISKYMG
ncbi:basic amino acid ABC transporter substrate-binding protein [Ignisphaera sp. 4213-co]|uniref:Basic amino acid ABC transporter substrate-binding protein n=1 Tax=Ignisphaera cupida TaxID=3050454 RepID=A0ABD4Z6I7_9CREN|nr:basic amino acid ABC transporter substrate-binding protein [Ignisphaera sp. 4213-co]MDK6028844.1 basic amino acid ABC transporter substrate-binding protein [Ignisphaera sp. 4213-co]